MIYLNNAATSFPKPHTVIEAVNQYLSNPPGSIARSTDRSSSSVITSVCRDKLAQFFHLPTPERFVFTSGGTESLNLAIDGLPLIDCHVITSNMEHNSMLRPIFTLKQEGKIDVSVIDCITDNSSIIDQLHSVFRTDTRLIALNHASNVTGKYIDLNKVVDFARNMNTILLIDASQSVGNYEYDLSQLDIDLLAFTCHKSMLSMQGVGGLYINPRIDLQPLKVGGTGSRSELLTQPDIYPTKFEAGTQNIPGIVSLCAAINYLSNIRTNALHKKNQLLDVFIDSFKDNSSIELFYPRDENIPISLLSFRLRDVSPEDTGFILEESYDIVTRTGLMCAPLVHRSLGTYPHGLVRISPSHFTTEDEIYTLIEAINKIIQVVI